jgi:DNA-binding HxlR family transcriptional regulator
MVGYGQFCAVARAHEALGGRWTLLIVRELLCGSRRFNEIRRGVPRISRTMLAERLQELVHAGAVTRIDGERGPEYELSEAGAELAGLIGALASWGQKWLPRHAAGEDLDLDPVLVDMARRARSETLPREPLVLRFMLQRQPTRFILLKAGESSLCSVNPGFPEPLTVCGPLHALVAWWRGEASFLEAQRTGLSVEGPRALARVFPTWFARYQFADIAPAAEAAAARSVIRTP